MLRISEPFQEPVSPWCSEGSIQAHNTVTCKIVGSSGFNLLPHLGGYTSSVTYHTSWMYTQSPDLHPNLISISVISKTHSGVLVP